MKFIAVVVDTHMNMCAHTSTCYFRIFWVGESIQSDKTSYRKEVEKEEKNKVREEKKREKRKETSVAGSWGRDFGGH